VGISREPEDVLYSFAEVCCVSEEVGEDVSLSADEGYQNLSLCLAEAVEWM
jgi:hypothetical protein